MHVYTYTYCLLYRGRVCVPWPGQATELVYYEDMWAPLEALLKDVTREARGVRMSGAAAANLCHLATGVVDAYYQFNLKPWVRRGLNGGEGGGD